jgi:hypothetical protein
MIYEMTTQDLRPGSVPEVEKRFGEMYEKRKQFSELAALWHTEIGPLNQIVHVWPYQDIAERMRICEAAEKAEAWPPDISQFLVKTTAEIMIPFEFSPEIKPAKVGPYFEMRSYLLVAGEMPLLQKAWGAALPERLELGPLCAVWRSELGVCNKFVQIWPFQTLEQRAQVRSKAAAARIWPPSARPLKEGERRAKLDAQENKILLPASFSPLQ